MSSAMESLILQRIEELSAAFAVLFLEVRKTNALLRATHSTEPTARPDGPDVAEQHAGFVAAATARHIAAKGARNG